MNNWISKYNLSRYAGNNIAKLHNGEIYHRIVIVNNIHLRVLEKETFPNGHTKILVTNSKGVVVKESKLNVKLDYYRFKKYDMEIYH